MNSRSEKLGEQAEFWYKNMSDVVFKHSTFQLIILGWIVSIENQFKSADTVTLIVVSISVLVYSIFATGIYYELRDKSNYVFSRLNELDEELSQDFLRFKISRKFFLSATIVHFSVSLVSILLILRIYLERCSVGRN